MKNKREPKIATLTLSLKQSSSSGPGLGTEPLVQSNVISIIHKLKAANLNVPLVIDADGLKLVAEHPGLIQDYRGPVYLTPNKREYENLLSGSEVNAAYIKQGE